MNQLIGKKHLNIADGRRNIARSHLQHHSHIEITNMQGRYENKAEIRRFRMLRLLAHIIQETISIHSGKRELAKKA